METIIVSLICIALIVFGGMTMSQGFMTSVDASTTGLEEVGHRDESLIRTSLEPVSAGQTAANIVEIVLENAGQTKLADFNKWDVIIHYMDESDEYHVKWLPYSEGTLADDEWQVAWLRLNGGTEVIEPNVLNPGEQMMIRAQLNPPVGADTTNLAVVATPSGVTVSTYFTP